MKLGANENTVFKIFHPDALDLYNVCSDLRKVCHELKDPNKRLQSHVFFSLSLSLFFPL